MTALYITGAVLFLLVLLCLCPVGLRIKYKDEFSVYAVIGFVKIKLIPKEKKIRISDYSEKKMRKQEARRKKKLERAAKKQKPETAGAKKESRDSKLVASLEDGDRRFDMIEELYDMLCIVFDAFGKRLKLKFIRVLVIIGSPAPSTTAILYGGACAAASNILNLLGQYVNLEKKNKDSIIITPDFLSEKTAAEADVAISLKIGGIFAFLFEIRKIIMKIYDLLQEDNKNG